MTGLFLAIFSLGLALTILAFVMLGLFGEFLGAPYVPTSQKDIEEILKRAKLKKGQQFLELGSGDGRIIRAAVKNTRSMGWELRFIRCWFCIHVSNRDWRI
jgi:tRNA A58 N-methylase Trm61